MKTFKHLRVALIAACLLVAATTFAGPAIKTYQVTGPVLEVSDSMIVVQKNDEKWAVARDTNTKVNGDLKVGDKVTIEYHMVATTVEVKKDAKAKK
jgi:hypothetical protein